MCARSEWEIGVADEDPDWEVFGENHDHKVAGIGLRVKAVGVLTFGRKRRSRNSEEIPTGDLGDSGLDHQAIGDCIELHRGDYDSTRKTMEGVMSHWRPAAMPNDPWIFSVATYKLMFLR
jgi:predicted porin